MARVLHPYTATSDGELTIAQGDTLEVRRPGPRRCSCVAGSLGA